MSSFAHGVLLAATIAIAACAAPATAPAWPTFAAPIERASAAVVAIADAPIEAGAGGRADPRIVGSGFRIAGTHVVATAAHVVGALRGAPVVVWQARRFPARVLRLDQAADLALLEIDPSAPMPGLTLANDEAAEPGAWVLVLGYPFGSMPTATTGIVSARPGAILRPESLRGQMQLNAAVNPGNSGGPVVNLDAEVIGVANATVPAGYGLGFAVPVSRLQKLLELGRAAPGR